MDLLGRYSNPDNVARPSILAGQGRDRPSHRPVPSVRQQQTRLTDSQHSELLERYLAGEPPRPRQRVRRPPRHRLQPPATRRVQTAIASLATTTSRSPQDVRGRSVSRCDRRALRRGRTDRLNAFRRAGVPTRGPGDQPVEPESVLTALARRSHSNSMCRISPSRVRDCPRTRARHVGARPRRGREPRRGPSTALVCGHAFDFGWPPPCIDRTRRRPKRRVVSRLVRDADRVVW